MFTNEIEEGIEWAKKNKASGHFLETALLEELIRRTDEKRTQGGRGVQEAKRHALLEMTNAYSSVNTYRDVYSSTASHIYAMRRKAAEEKRKEKIRTGTGPREDVPPLESYTEVYASIAARTGERD